MHFTSSSSHPLPTCGIAKKIIIMRFSKQFPITRWGYISTDSDISSQFHSRPTSIDEGEEEQDEEEEEDESMAKLVQEPSAPSPFEQLGQALKIMGTFMSWARAINPSEGQSSPRSNAEILPKTAVAGGQRLQSQLRKGLIGESRADSGWYC